MAETWKETTPTQTTAIITRKIKTKQVKETFFWVKKVDCEFSHAAYQPQMSTKL